MIRRNLVILAIATASGCVSVQPLLQGSPGDGVSTSRTHITSVVVSPLPKPSDPDFRPYTTAETLQEALMMVGNDGSMRNPPVEMTAAEFLAKYEGAFDNLDNDTDKVVVYVFDNVKSSSIAPLPDDGDMNTVTLAVSKKFRTCVFRSIVPHHPRVWSATQSNTP